MRDDAATGAGGHEAAIPWGRLGTFYFFYFALLGGFMPYWSLYLQHLGFEAAAIGQLMALAMLTRLVAPNLWGWLADTSGQRLRIVRIGAFFTMALFALVFVDQGFWWLAFALFSYSFFQNAILAQFEAVTMAHLGEQRAFYARVRLGGSIGFIVTVAGFGALLKLIAIDWLPWMLLACTVGIWLASLTIPDRPTPRKQAGERGIWQKLRQPAVLSFFVASFLLQLAHGPYYTFFSIHLEAHGYARDLIGGLWALGVAAEVVLFWFMHQVLERHSLRTILIWSLWLAALRWLLIGWAVDSIVVLILAQLLHAASFGSYHAAAIAFLYREFGQGQQGQGQALYSALGYGLGSALGAWASGQLWESVGASWTYTLAGAVTVVAALQASRWLREDA